MRVPSELTTSTYRVRVGYADTDQGSVVHHSTYLRYLESARVELMRERGLTYKHLELDQALALPVVEANLRYRQPARFDDVLEITTWIAVAHRAKIRFDSVIRCGATTLTQAELTLACIKLPEGKLCSMPDVILALADESIRGKR